MVNYIRRTSRIRPKRGIAKRDQLTRRAARNKPARGSARKERRKSWMRTGGPSAGSFQVFEIAQRADARRRK